MALTDFILSYFIGISWTLLSINLYFQNLQPSLDTGTYQCLARNPAGITPLKDAHSYFLQFPGIEAVSTHILLSS